MTIAILLIEHDALIQETLVYMLDVLKYNVVAVEDANQAIKALQATAFDVLTISLSPSDKTGSAIAEAAKKIQRDLKIIVVSGWDTPTAMPDFVDAHVQKPFTLTQFQHAVEQVTSHRMNF